MSRDSEDKQRSKLLSLALRAVRAIRNVKPRALAEALGLSLRGYQHFEAGGGQLNIDHVMAFAQASDADPIGILTAVQIGKPEFAAWVAQNKAMIAFMIALQEFAEGTGEAMTRLETTTWVSAYREMFKDLSQKALAAQAQNDAWLADAARVGLGKISPGTDQSIEEEADGTDQEDGEAPDSPDADDGGDDRDPGGDRS
jgi:transcriptional regulator with XRE-family HTH domain